jgi:uncharacterized protein YjbJ (UPF0337 family)
MTRDRIAGSWKQMAGMMRESWGRLVADKAAISQGQRDRLIGRIQQRHGISLDLPHRTAIPAGRA